MMRISKRKAHVVWAWAVLLIIIRAFADAYKTGKQQWFRPFCLPTRARLHQRQTQCTKNRTSATSSRRNSTGRDAPSPGSPASSASRAKTPTRSSTENGSIQTCCSKSAICWTMISSSALRIGEKKGKRIKNNHISQIIRTFAAQFRKRNVFSTLIHY